MRRSTRSRWRSPSPDSSSMFRAVRRAAVLLAALAFAPAAHAAAPAVSAQATPATGAAPLQVTLSASGDLATYHWDLGDGTTADGQVIQHTYAAGRFTARVTATNPLGETSEASGVVTATRITLVGSGSGRYQQRARFHGRLVPAVKGARVALYRNEHRLATVRAERDGTFFVRGRVGTPDARYTVRYAGVSSNAVTL